MKKKHKLILYPRSFEGTIVSVLSDTGIPVYWDDGKFVPLDGVSVGEVLIANPASERDLSAAGLTTDKFEVAEPGSSN